MPIEVQHQPSAAVIGEAAYEGGAGQAYRDNLNATMQRALAYAGMAHSSYENQQNRQYEQLQNAQRYYADVQNRQQQAREHAAHADRELAQQKALVGHRASIERQNFDYELTAKQRQREAQLHNGLQNVQEQLQAGKLRPEEAQWATAQLHAMHAGITPPARYGSRQQTGQEFQQKLLEQSWVDPETGTRFFPKGMVDHVMAPKDAPQKDEKPIRNAQGFLPTEHHAAVIDWLKYESHVRDLRAKTTSSLVGSEIGTDGAGKAKLMTLEEAEKAATRLHPLQARPHWMNSTPDGEQPSPAGVPRPTTRAEVEQLPSGSQFVWTDGTTRTVP